MHNHVLLVIAVLLVVFCFVFLCTIFWFAYMLRHENVNQYKANAAVLASTMVGVGCAAMTLILIGITYP